MILKYRLIAIRNNFKYHNHEKKVKILLLILLAILFFFGEYRFFFKIFNYLREEVEFLSKHLTIQLVNILNLTFLSMLFFSNLTNSIYYFFVSDDLELLISYPIKTERLVIHRYLLNTISSSWMVIFAMIPFYIAIFKVFNFNKFYLFLIFFHYILFFFIASAFGCLITLFIVRFFPAKRAYQILWSISALFIATIFVVIRLIRPERLFRPVTEKEFMNFLKGLETPEYPYLPSTWITKGFSSLVFENNISEHLIYLFLLLLSALISFFLFVFIAKKIYLWSFSKSKSDFSKRKIKSSKLNFIANILPLRREAKQFFLKDLKEITRDTGQWSQLLLLLGLVFVYLFSIKSLPIQQVITMNMVAFFNIGILEFIMSALINRFIFPSFSQEGKLMWIVKSFPIKVEQLFFSKFLLYLFPLLFFGILLSIFSNELLRVDRFIYAFTIINVLTMTPTLVFFGLAFGMIYPNFKFSNVTEVSFSFGGIIYMLISMIYIGISLILQAGPVYGYLKSKLFAQALNYKSFILSFSILVFFSIILCIYFFKKAKSVWENFE